MKARKHRSAYQLWGTFQHSWAEIKAYKCSDHSFCPQWPFKERKEWKCSDHTFCLSALRDFSTSALSASVALVFSCSNWTCCCELSLAAVISCFSLAASSCSFLTASCVFWTCKQHHSNRSKSLRSIDLAERSQHAQHVFWMNNRVTSNDQAWLAVVDVSWLMSLSSAAVSMSSWMLGVSLDTSSTLWLNQLLWKSPVKCFQLHIGSQSRSEVVNHEQQEMRCFIPGWRQPPTKIDVLLWVWIRHRHDSDN